VVGEIALAHAAGQVALLEHAAEWEAKMAGARVTRWDLEDALDAYGHYWENGGEPFMIDYDEAYREDESVRANVTVDGGAATMTVTVHAEGYDNVNRGQADIASGAPDDAGSRRRHLVQRDARIP
jgi:hypothetical protein